MEKIKLYIVEGIDEFQGSTFAHCTTLAKAKKAKKILESEGFDNILKICKSNIAVDTIELDNKTIEL